MKKYPWTRFQVWLAKQPDNRLAGIVGQDVIITFLNEKTKNHKDMAVVMPPWALRLILALNARLDAPGGVLRYQYRTVKRLFRRVVKELRGQHAQS